MPEVIVDILCRVGIKASALAFIISMVAPGFSECDKEPFSQTPSTVDINIF